MRIGQCPLPCRVRPTTVTIQEVLFGQEVVNSCEKAAKPLIGYIYGLLVRVESSGHGVSRIVSGITALIESQYSKVFTKFIEQRLIV